MALGFPSRLHYSKVLLSNIVAISHRELSHISLYVIVLYGVCVSEKLSCNLCWTQFSLPTRLHICQSPPLDDLERNSRLVPEEMRVDTTANDRFLSKLLTWRREERGV